MEYKAFLICSFIFIVSLLFIKLCSKQNKKVPPGPRKLPILGNLHQLVGDLPHICLKKLSKLHGPLMLLQLGSVPTLVISSSDVARDIFKTHDINFSNRPQLYVVEKLCDGPYDADGISFAPHGEYWRYVKKILLVELLSVKRVESFRSMREEEVELIMKLIARSSPNPVNLTQLMSTLSINVVCRAVFGKSYGNSEEGCNGKITKLEILKIFEITTRLIGEFNVADFYPIIGRVLNKVSGVDSALKKGFKAMDELFDEIISCNSKMVVDGHDNNANETLIEVLLRLQKDPNQPHSLTNSQVKAIMSDVIEAGTVTTSTVLVWIMTELTKNPMVMTRAQDEVRQVVTGIQGVVESDLTKLAYLKSVIKETLRLHPPTPLLLPRETIEACQIGEYEIPAKTRVIINAKAISMDPNVWDNPEKFDPERFVINSIDYRRKELELISFGVGRRICPGINFALGLIELALANLLYCFDWSLPEGVTRDDIDMTEGSGLTAHKSEPLQLSPIPKFLL